MNFLEITELRWIFITLNEGGGVAFVQYIVICYIFYNYLCSILGITRSASQGFCLLSVVVLYIFVIISSCVLHVVRGTSGVG